MRIYKEIGKDRRPDRHTDIGWDMEKHGCREATLDRHRYRDGERQIDTEMDRSRDRRIEIQMDTEAERQRD